MGRRPGWEALVLSRQDGSLRHPGCRLPGLGEDPPQCSRSPKWTLPQGDRKWSRINAPASLSSWISLNQGMAESGFGEKRTGVIE